MAPSRLSVGIFLSLCLGCGKGPPYEVAPVVGQVTLDGEPLDGGIVTFVPEKAQKVNVPIGLGEIQEDGSYNIVTDPGGAALPGAAVGLHRIRISLDRYQKAELRNAKPDDARPIPKKFQSENTSGLSVEVRAGITNTVNLDLKRPEPAY